MASIKEYLKDLDKGDHPRRRNALKLFRYLGPGLLVTVGFIDPGNWACNLAAGSSFGYDLLWLITLSTIMLILLQHNAAHLGIATGLCLSEATNKYVKKNASRFLLSTAMLASVSTSLAEILGAAIALNMLFKIPILIGSILATVFTCILLLTNSYKIIERWIIAFVSIIGLSFIYELHLVDINWTHTAISLVKPVIPHGSLLILMSVLGAVVMPHNLYLHSEIIQSREWNLKDDKVIKKQLRFEYFDTIFSMIVGWAINCAMIILAATTFFQHNVKVVELQQSQNLLRPLLGDNATLIFALALFCAGFASTITSGLAGGTIFAGLVGEEYDIKDNHTRLGIIISLFAALIIFFFISDPFKALLISQMLLSIQLPFTIFLLIYLTASKKVMGKWVNKKSTTILLLIVGLVVVYFNVRLLLSLFVN